jgi:hypothetical protein
MKLQKAKKNIQLKIARQKKCKLGELWHEGTRSTLIKDFSEINIILGTLCYVYLILPNNTEYQQDVHLHFFFKKEKSRIFARTRQRISSLVINRSFKHKNMGINLCKVVFKYWILSGQISGQVQGH